MRTNQGWPVKEWSIQLKACNLARLFTDKEVEEREVTPRGCSGKKTKKRAGRRYNKLSTTAAAEEVNVDPAVGGVLSNLFLILALKEK